MSTSSYLIVWPDSTPLPTVQDMARTAASAASAGGELLAFGPVVDVVEEAARQAPTWAMFARFEDPELARRWYRDHAAPVAPGTAVILDALDAPVWWPAEVSGERPDWSRRGEVPPDRLGLLVSIWLDVRDIESLLDYSDHFRWTVERHDGVVLGIGAISGVVAGASPPLAMALMTWPTSAKSFGWYESADYAAYRRQRHAASNSTVISVAARGHVTVPPNAASVR